MYLTVCWMFLWPRSAENLGLRANPQSQTFTDMSHFLLNIAKRSLLRLMLGGVGLASKNAV